MADANNLEGLARTVRYWILYMTTKAGSGHATSSLSAVDLMTCLFFKALRFDVSNPKNLANDRVIFSKGHASPLLYALWTVAGVIGKKDLDNYRQLGSELEGHPTPRFKYVDVATGSLGQGLSIGLGMSLALRQAISTLNSQLSTLPKVYVLMGDSEFAEGSVWEALEVASYYKVDNLVGIIDVNRLGQSGETMLGWDTEKYQRRIESFGWQAYVVNGHDIESILKTFEKLQRSSGKPQMIIAKTVKGRGVSFLEDKEGWHGVALKEDEFKKAVGELGDVDKSARGFIAGPAARYPRPTSSLQSNLNIKSKMSSIAAGARRGSPTRVTRKLDYKLGEMIATRKAYGEALVRIGRDNQAIVALDAEVKNSTFSEVFKDKYPNRFYEMFIAEQNMVAVALGFSKMGYVPFVSTFAAFLTRAFDQIRMSAISAANIKFVGSHAGVSIGEDGPSQMGLEDFAMFRAVFGSVVLCPADAVAASKLVEIAANKEGVFYIRTNRPKTPVIYSNDEEFQIGKSKVLRSSKSDRLLIVSCGVALIEALNAADILKKDGVNIRVIDVYSIKPIDESAIKKSARETSGKLIVIEDHYFDGGLGDAVLNVFASEEHVQMFKLAVSKLPMSGKGDKLLDYEGISAKKIVAKVLEILK